MHSRKKGKSGSKKPVNPALPSWVNYKSNEVEALVLKLAKSENSPSKIGIILRDSYGIPNVKIITKKKILQILKDNKSAPKLPEDLIALVEKYVATAKHIEKNHKDQGAVRGLQLAISKINRLSKYYKKKKILPAEWRFEPTKAKLLLE